MRKNDLILASAMVIIALVWFLTVFIDNTDGNMVIVSKDNKIIESHLLTEDGEYTVLDNGRTVMRYIISDSSVDVIYADCPDKICVNHHSVSQNRDVIVCLPNRIVIEVTDNGNEDSSQIHSDEDVDVIAY